MAVRFGSSGASNFQRTASLPAALSNPFTICGWATPSANASFTMLCAMEIIDDGGHWWQLGFDRTSNSVLRHYSSNDGEFVTGLDPGTTAPFFWAASFTSNLVATFAIRSIANAALSTAALAAYASESFTPNVLNVGNDIFGEYYDGRIWNVKFWDRALTTPELLIESYYARVMFPSSLNFHWPMFNAADVRDLSGNARNATSGGTLTTEDGAHGLWRPRRKVIYIPSAGGGQTIAAGLNTETDSAFAVTHAKVKAVGLNAETDSVLTLTKAKLKAIGLNTETDSVLAVARLKSRTPGLNTETDTVLAATKAKQKAAGLNTETDSVLAATRVKARAVGLNAETDSTQSVAHSKARTVALNTETDEALSLVEDNEIVVEVGLASETDTAQPVTKLKQKLIGICLEVADALTLGRLKTRSAGLNTETDTTLTTTRSKARAAGLTTETDSAFSVARLKRMLVGLATEVDIAFSFITGGVAPTGRRGRSRRNVRLGTYERGR